MSLSHSISYCPRNSFQSKLFSAENDGTGSSVAASVIVIVTIHFLVIDYCFQLSLSAVLRVAGFHLECSCGHIEGFERIGERFYNIIRIIVVISFDIVHRF